MSSGSWHCLSFVDIYRQDLLLPSSGFSIPSLLSSIWKQ
jgi:hypothetical protein